MVVIKFGGQTLSDTIRVSRCLDLVGASVSRKPVVVVSAHGNVTNDLIAAANRAKTGEIKLGDLRRYHLELAKELGVAAGIIDPLLVRLETLLHGIGLIKELTPRTMDHVLSFGERLSSRIIAAALTANGYRAVPVNAYDVGLITDERYGQARPLPGIEKKLKQNLSKISDIAVVTGFIGKDESGEITTLGRSGSDYTATLIAAAMGAEEVVIYKSVDGIMSADPSVDPAARNIPQMSFDEASELAYFGAEVLHLSTLVPAIRKNIPVRVANALKDNDPGTVILSRPVVTKGIAKSVAYKEDVTLFHLSSSRLHAVPEVLNTALAALKMEGIVAHMITTSEAGISLITQSGLDKKKLQRAKDVLSAIAPVGYYPAMSIICVVGEELRGRADSLGKIFTKLAEAKINPRAVTRSASEINVAFLVENKDTPQAVRALHSLIVSARR